MSADRCRRPPESGGCSGFRAAFSTGHESKLARW